MCEGTDHPYLSTLDLIIWRTRDRREEP